MIRCELLDQDIVVVMPEGPLEEADFERLAHAVDPIIAARGKLAGFAVCAPAFPGWHDFGAFRAHLKFVAHHHRGIERIAVVTDSGLKILARIAGVFLHPDIKPFDFAEKDRALAWLQAGG